MSTTGERARVDDAVARRRRSEFISHSYGHFDTVGVRLGADMYLERTDALIPSGKASQHDYGCLPLFKTRGRREGGLDGWLNRPTRHIIG